MNEWSWEMYGGEGGGLLRNPDYVFDSLFLKYAW